MGHYKGRDVLRRRRARRRRDEARVRDRYGISPVADVVNILALCAEMMRVHARVWARYVAGPLDLTPRVDVQGPTAEPIPTTMHPDPWG